MRTEAIGGGRRVRATRLSVIVLALMVGTFSVSGPAAADDPASVAGVVEPDRSLAAESTVGLDSVVEAPRSRDAAAPGGASLAPAAIDNPATFTAVSPARILNSRDGTGGVAVGEVAGGATISFPVVGVGNVPANAKSVVLNVTAAGPVSEGYLTVYPSGATRPDASNLNFSAGKTVANLVVAKVGADGRVSIYNFGGRVHIIADVTGYFVEATTAGRFYPIVPRRVFDTRKDARLSGAVIPIGQAGTLRFSFAGNQTPQQSRIVAVMLNITATRPTVGGYLTVYPSGEELPNSSNVNFIKDQTVANAVIVKLGTSGTDSAITIFNALGNTDVLIDLIGVFDDGTQPSGFNFPTVYRALDQPERVYNTRIPGVGAFGPQTARFVKVTEARSAPAGAIAAVMNATATDTSTAGYLAIFPAGLSDPGVSAMNWSAGETVPNFVGSGLSLTGQAGRVTVYNDTGSTNVLLDVTGYFYDL